ALRETGFGGDDFRFSRSWPGVVVECILLSDCHDSLRMNERKIASAGKTVPARLQPWQLINGAAGKKSKSAMKTRLPHGHRLWRAGNCSPGLKHALLAAR